jgi:hypothetical protein
MTKPGRKSARTSRKEKAAGKVKKAAAGTGADARRARDRATGAGGLPEGTDRRWDWIAITAFGVLAILVFAGFVFSDKMLAGTDMIPMGYMMRKVVADYWKATGSIPQWDPYILCGLPVVDAMHGDLFYPVSVFYLLMPLHKALGYKIVVHVWLAGITMYFLLRTLGLRRRSSFIGGLAYMAAPYFLSLTYAGHDAKMFVTALFPLCVMLLERLLRRPGLLYCALFGGSVGLLLLTSHPQMAYFASWGLGIYLICSLRRIARNGVLVKAVVFTFVAVILGIGIGCVQFLPTYFYTTSFSPRTGGVSLSFATSWSLHPEEIVSLLYPSFVGYLDAYWGRNYFKLNAESPGPLVVLLAVGGFILLMRRRQMLPWLVLLVFCPVYALGAHTPLFKAIFYGIPVAKFLRAPSIIMFMFSCASCVLAAGFIDELLSKKISPAQKQIITGLLVFAAAMAVMLTAGRGMFLDGWKQVFAGLDTRKLQATAQAFSSLRADVLLLAAFAGTSLVLMQSAYGRRWKGALGVGALVAGILVTSLLHSTRFITYISVDDFRRTDPMIEFLKEDKGVFRTLPLTGSNFYDRNYLPMFGIETANGFYDNRVRYYDDLSGEGFRNLFDAGIMSLTNIKYVLTTQRVDHPSLSLRRDLGQAFVYENRDFLPRSFLVHRAVVAESDSAALAILKTPDFDPATTVVLHDGKAISGDSTVSGERVTIEDRGPDRVVLRATVMQSGYIYYSGNYLPHWKAYVDGAEVPVVRCNVSMRAVYVEPGEHTIRMEYASPWYRVGTYICLVSCLLVGLTVLVSVKFGGGRSRRA